MVPPPVTLEPSTVSIPSNAPEMPKNSVLTPQALQRESCTDSLRNFPKSRPQMPPKTIAIVLMMVPSPAMLPSPEKKVESIISRWKSMSIGEGQSHFWYIRSQAPWDRFSVGVDPKPCFS